MKTVLNVTPVDIIGWDEAKRAFRDAGAVLIYKHDNRVWRLNVEDYTSAFETFAFEGRTFSWRGLVYNDIHSEKTSGWDAFVSKNRGNLIGNIILFESAKEFTDWLRKNPSVIL